MAKDPDMSATAWRRALSKLRDQVMDDIETACIELPQGARLVAQMASASRHFIDAAEVEKKVAEIETQLDKRRQMSKHNVRKKSAFGLNATQIASKEAE